MVIAVAGEAGGVLNRRAQAGFWLIFVGWESAAHPDKCEHPALSAARKSRPSGYAAARLSKPTVLFHPAVLSITQVHAGHTWNVIPQQAVLRGTVRSFDAEAQDIIQRRIEKVSADVASAFDLEAQVRYERHYPPMVNAEAPTRIAIAAATAVVGELRSSFQSDRNRQSQCPDCRHRPSLNVSARCRG